jgi:uncharacterized protein (UPF0179 family)
MPTALGSILTLQKKECTYNSNPSYWFMLSILRKKKNKSKVKQIHLSKEAFPKEPGLCSTSQEVQQK